jgi:hypothetical protein
MADLQLTISQLSRDGFSVQGQALSPDVQRDLVVALGSVAGAGRRGLLAEPFVAGLACSSGLLELVRPHLRHDPRAVRAIYFDKSATANWLVPWHQDLTLAVRERVDTPGFGPWSVKDDIPHVQPPVEFLEQMLTVRLHLDAADASNGALRVLPGSHRLGRLSSEQIQQLRSQTADVLCEVCAGDAVLMRPLLLHASGRSTSAQHRRVLHIEYAGFILPEPLRWHESA